MNLPIGPMGNVDSFSRQWIENPKNVETYIGQVTPTITKLDGLIERLNGLKSNPLFEGIKQTIGSLEWMRSQVGVWYIEKGWYWYVRNEITLLVILSNEKGLGLNG